MNSPHDTDEDTSALPPTDAEHLLTAGDEEAKHADGARDRDRHNPSVLTRIPESLGAIGRDIKGTIERAMAAKDDYVVAVKVSMEAQDRLEQLVQAGVFRSRAEAAAYLIDEGIMAQAPLFERVEQKLAEIERLRAELRGMVGERQI
ncbi:MAG: hypothetical protein M3430_04800 [Acidobacteriota bacterium]|nr:hypothetical protein [Acidobacteriota bacterium]